jgi:hypothetical protein
MELMECQKSAATPSARAVLRIVTTHGGIILMTTQVAIAQVSCTGLLKSRRMSVVVPRIFPNGVNHGRSADYPRR